TTILVAAYASAQDAKKILNDAYAKCKEIKSANYEMIYRWKALTGKDTLIRTYKVDFEKLRDDSLYAKKFRLEQSQIYKGKNDTYAVWYTGNEEVELSPGDSTATITSKAEYGDEIKNREHNRIFYIPFTVPEKFFKKSIFNDSLATMATVGYEMIANN